MSPDTPTDYANPEWEKAGKVHDWRNHVSEELQAMWPTFTDAQKAAIARQAEDMAGREEWD